MDLSLREQWYSFKIDGHSASLTELNYMWTKGEESVATDKKITKNQRNYGIGMVIN